MKFDVYTTPGPVDLNHPDVRFWQLETRKSIHGFDEPKCADWKYQKYKKFCFVGRS
jgi:hypothetical protein